MAIRLLRALAAGVVLAGIVVGLPLLLLAFGRSPLDGLGSLGDQLQTLLTNPIDDVVLLGLMTMATWLLWGLFVVQVGVEAATLFGRGSPWRLPLSNAYAPGARRLVMALTMTASLAGPLGQRGGAAPAPMVVPVAAAVLDVPARPAAAPVVVGPVRDDRPASAASVLPVLPAATAAVPAAPAATAPSHGEGLPVVVVVPGDSPWVIAERHLGEGLRWREIWDLNRGVAQPDGRTWVEEDLIRPGWHLCLPADATGVAAPPGPSAPQPPPIEAPAPDAAPTPSESGGDNGSDAGAGGATTTTPSTTTSTTAPSSIADDAPVDGGLASDGSDDADAEDEGSWLVPGLLGVGGAMVAAATLRELRRRRERRLVALPAAALPPPAPRVQVDRELLVRGDPEPMDRLDAALVLLAGGVRPRSGQPCPQPRVVQLSEDRIDVLLDTAYSSPPKPWRAEASGLTWVLDDPSAPTQTDDPTPLPALVTIGADDSLLLIDVESYGVVSLVGDLAAARALARSITAELSSRFEGIVRVEVVGGALGGEVQRLDGVIGRATWAEVDASTIAASAGFLQAAGWPHTFAARASGRIWDGWAPTVWITEPGNDDDYRDAIAAVAAHPGSGSAILVVGADAGHGLRIHVSPDGAFDIPALGLHGQAQGVDGSTVDQLADLLDDADTPFAVLDPSVPEPDEDSDTGLDSGSESSAFEDPPFDVLVRLCGPIRVDGGRGELTAYETAIAAFVALHGQANPERLQDSVWAGTLVTRKRIQNVISALRNKVGDAVSLHGGQVVAGERLVTDIDLIKRRLRHADEDPDPRRRADILQGGFDLVNGRVCWYPRSDRRAWTWIDLDHWINRVEQEVGKLATQLIRLYLDLDDGENAAHVAQKAIDAIGRHDDLVINLVHAHELAGNDHAARAAIRAHAKYLADLGTEETNEEILTLLDRYAPPDPHSPED